MISLSFSQSTTPIKSSNFTNLYQVNSEIYRSDQPTKKGMLEIDSLGIRTVLNLRNHRNDKSEARLTTLNLRRVKINAWKMDYQDLVDALKSIKNSEKPLLVHCLHGSDRTGAVIAGYRIAFENWSKSDAISEFTEPKYGFHKDLFPEILTLLEAVQPNQLKSDLGLIP